MNAYDEYVRRERRQRRITAAIAWVIVIAGTILAVFGIVGVVGFLIAIFG